MTTSGTSLNGAYSYRMRVDDGIETHEETRDTLEKEEETCPQWCECVMNRNESTTSKDYPCIRNATLDETLFIPTHEEILQDIRDHKNGPYPTTPESQSTSTTRRSTSPNSPKGVDEVFNDDLTSDMSSSIETSIDVHQITSLDSINLANPTIARLKHRLRAIEQEFRQSQKQAAFAYVPKDDVNPYSVVKQFVGRVLKLGSTKLHR